MVAIWSELFGPKMHTYTCVHTYSFSHQPRGSQVEVRTHTHKLSVRNFAPVPDLNFNPTCRGLSRHDKLICKTVQIDGDEMFGAVEEGWRSPGTSFWRRGRHFFSRCNLQNRCHLLWTEWNSRKRRPWRHANCTCGLVVVIKWGLLFETSDWNHVVIAVGGWVDTKKSF